MILSINSTTSAETNNQSGSTGQSVTFTVKSGDDRLLVALLAYELTAGALGVNAIVASYGGTALTTVIGSGSGVNWAGVAYLPNPPITSTAFTWAVVTQTVAELKCALLCVNGANTASPSPATTSVVSVAASVSCTLTPTLNSCWMVDVVNNNSSNAICITSGVAPVTISNLTGSGFGFGASYRTQTGAPAAMILGWTSTATNAWVQSAAILFPADTGMLSPRSGYWGDL